MLPDRHRVRVDRTLPDVGITVADLDSMTA